MNVLVESHIPYLKGILEPFATVEYAPAADFTPERLAKIDALVVRTTVKCNAQLLEGSAVRFIASATIGLDHVDQDYCASRGITVANAPGCNADAVAQWVFASIRTLYPQDYAKKRLGIVGVGHIGSLVNQWARSMGMETMLCDPPRQDRGEQGFVKLHEIARECDIITFHTPLTHDGVYKTFHLCNKEFLETLKQKPAIFNASRGPVVDNNALVKGLDTGKISAVAIDTWENEPNISLPLLEQAAIATPHIAGYSRNGKIRASAMVVDSFSRFLGQNVPFPMAMPSVAETMAMDDVGYDILADDNLLRSQPRLFTELRDTYKLR